LSVVVGTSLRRSLWAKVGLLLCSVVFSLVLGEVLLRLFSSWFPREIRPVITASPDQLGVYHPDIGYLLPPNASIVYEGRDYSAVHHTDRYGFRNSNPWPQRAAIVAVGDSLTFGYGVEDDQAWPEVINRALPELRVMNLGVIGAGPQQYLRAYEDFGRKLRPRLLLVGFFTRNDFSDADIFDRWVKSGGKCNFLVWRAYGQPHVCVRNWWWRGMVLARSSYLQNLLRFVRSTVRDRFDSERKSVQLQDGSRLVLDIGKFTNNTEGALEDTREFSLVSGALKKLNSIAEADGTKMLVVLQPSKEEVYVPFVGEKIANPNTHLLETLKEAGIESLDLTKAFQQHAAKGEKLFFEVDGHPNAAGYALIAEAVLDHVKQNAAEYGLDIPD
jgi:lysophospholipase L1-like esterase